MGVYGPGQPTGAPREPGRVRPPSTDGWGEDRTGSSPEFGRDQACVRRVKRQGWAGLPSDALIYSWPVTVSMRAGIWKARENRRY